MPASPLIAIFDLDGTLVDSRQDIAISANHARRTVGLAALPVETVGEMVGDGIVALIERLTPEQDPAGRERALQAFQSHYALHGSDHTGPFPGVVPMLVRLRRSGWKIAVATNKATAFTLGILDRSGLAPLIDAVRGPERWRKPDPGQILDLCRELRATPGQGWMIGDHHTDLRAGAAAGCRTLFCSWGYGQRDGITADGEASSPTEVPGLLGLD